MKTKTKILLNIVSIFLLSLSMTLFVIYLFYTNDLKDQRLTGHRKTLHFILSLIDERVQALQMDMDVQTKQGEYSEAVYADIVGSITDYFSVKDSQSIMIFNTESGSIIYPPSGRGRNVPDEVLSGTDSQVEGELVLPEKLGYFVNYPELGLTFFAFSQNRDIFRYRNMLLFAVVCLTAMLILIVTLITGTTFGKWYKFLNAAAHRFLEVVQGKRMTPAVIRGEFDCDEENFITSYNAMAVRIENWVKQREEKLNDLMKQRDNLKKIVYMYRKYIPDKTLLQLNEKNINDTVSRRWNVTSLMIELQDFLLPINELYPQVITDELNDFHAFLKASATQKNGLINFSSGHQVNLVFGIPRGGEKSFINTVQCAKDTLGWITERNKSDMNKSGVKWKVRMGLSSGIGVTGVVGNEYLVIGDLIETSARMLDRARHFGVYLVTDSAQDLKKTQSLHFRKLDLARSSRGAGTALYEIFLREHEMMEQAIKLYTHGLDMYYEKKYEMAVYDFKKVIQIFKEDRPSALFLEKCEDHLREKFG